MSRQANDTLNPKDLRNSPSDFTSLKALTTDHFGMCLLDDHRLGPSIFVEFS